MIINKSHKCPYRAIEHENLAFVEYYNGHWCYSCNKGSFQDRSYYKQIDQYRQVSSFTFDNQIYNPKEFPQYILAFLYKYYVFDELIRKYYISYLPSNGYKPEFLQYPIIDGNGTLIAYQRRFFPHKNFYSLGTNNCIFECGNFNTNSVVLLEDYLSTIRVGEVDNSICLFGTNLNNNILNYITSHFLNVIIWLDGDEPGQKAAKKIQKKIITCCNNNKINKAFAIRESRMVRIIKTELDPKCYSDSDIKEILK